MTKTPTKRQVSRTVLRTGGVPRGHITKGLKFPTKGGNQADMIQKRLKNKSPWYQSLMDPLHGAEVKIPDATGFETGTLQLVHRDTLIMPTGADACAGFRVVCPLPNLSGGGPQSLNYQFTDTGSATGSVLWPIVADALPFETSEALRAYSDGVRVVSASLCVQSEASLSDNSGIFTGYINPYPDVPEPSTQPLTVYNNHYKTAIVPINTNQPILVRYMPVKQNGGQYDMFYQPSNPAGPASSTEVTVPYYEMGVLLSGAPAGTTFLITVVVNYEFLPFENAINILDAKPSPVDAQEVDLVENWVQTMDVVTETTSRSQSSSPSASKVEEPGQGTGFGMWAETILEIAPMLLGLLL